MASISNNDLTTLSASAAKVVAYSNLLLVSPQSDPGYQPQNPLNPLTGTPLAGVAVAAKFLFHYEGDQSLTVESDITDHFIESNSTVQDHISLKPVLYQTKGYIGELNDVPPFLLGIARGFANRLTALTAYSPKLTVAAQEAYNAAFFAYQTAANVANTAIMAAQSLANLVTGSDGVTTIDGNGTILFEANQDRQQTAFQLFYGYWVARQLFTIQTPWASFQNMAIMRLRPIQDDETRVITAFEMTFKQMRFTNSIVSTSIEEIEGRLLAAASSVVDKGTNPVSPAESLTEGTDQMAAGE